MLTILDSKTVLKMMAEFDKNRGSQSSLFKFVQTYMRMVLLIYTFTRDGLLELHRPSLDALCKYLLMTRKSMPGWFHFTLPR